MISQKRTATALLVTCPYNPDFRAVARRLGGEWKAAEKVWAFPLTVTDAVEDACDKIFRIRQANPDAKGLTIRITATRDLEGDRAPRAISSKPPVQLEGYFVKNYFATNTYMWKTPDLRMIFSPTRTTVKEGHTE